MGQGNSSHGICLIARNIQYQKDQANKIVFSEEMLYYLQYAQNYLINSRVWSKRHLQIKQTICFRKCNISADLIYNAVKLIKVLAGAKPLSK